MSVAIPIIIRLLSLFGIKLSPFVAGAIVAGVIIIAFAGYSGWLVHRGYAWAGGKCEARALQSKIDALEADRDAGHAALADARLRSAGIELQANAEREGTAAYVEDLKARFASACAITDDDLRGLRIVPRGGAAAGSAARGESLDAARGRAAGRQGR